jgi:hypothetical protein
MCRLDVMNGTMLLAWKNGIASEDKRGQQILYSVSANAQAWSRASTLFPDMSTKQNAAMFVGPPIQIRGRWYVGASPGVPTGAAQGVQFCLWPDPLDLPDDMGGRSNRGPPAECCPSKHYKQAKDTLLMRQVIPTSSGVVSLGDVFWFASEAPAQWVEASQKLGFKARGQMDATTVSDMATLDPQIQKPLPCGPRKCEACAGGCQVWDAIPKAVQPFIGNERTHYDIPHSDADMILYRSGAAGFLWASYRANKTAAAGEGPEAQQRAWGAPVMTNLPNDESNINTGTLPDGRVYLLNNPVFRPKPTPLGDLGTSSARSAEGLRFRDPIAVALSTDGKRFSKVVSVMSCGNLSATSTCKQRLAGSGKNWGPSYPQGIALGAADVAGTGFKAGLYVVATNNKEDVWLAWVDLADLKQDI